MKTELRVIAGLLAFIAANSFKIDPNPTQPYATLAFSILGAVFMIGSSISAWKEK